MARDSSLYVRRAVITALKRDAGVAAIVGEKIHAVAESNPDWPFVRYGAATTLPYRATGMDGNRIALTMHAFAKDSDEVDGYDQVQQLAAAIANALERQTLPLAAPYPTSLHAMTWTATQVIEDSEEASAFHGIVNFEARLSS